MKSLHLFIFLCFVSLSIFAQQNARFYQTIDGQYAFKLENKSCVLYTLSGYTVSNKTDLAPESEFEQPLDSMGILYANDFFAVSYDYREFSVVKMKKGKPVNRKTYRARQLKDPAKLIEGINHYHWDREYAKMLDEIEYTYQLFGPYRYRDFDDSWQKLEFKQASPEEFKIQAQQQIAILKNNCVRANEQLISLNNSVEENWNTLTLEEVITNFQSRPLNEYAYSKYTGVFLRSTAENRPDLYFEMIEALPEQKEYLFRYAASSRDIHRSLANYDTAAEIKKEYLKYKRREQVKGILILTGAGILEAGSLIGLALIFI